MDESILGGNTTTDTSSVWSGDTSARPRFNRGFDVGVDVPLISNYTAQESLDWPTGRVSGPTLACDFQHVDGVSCPAMFSDDEVTNWAMLEHTVVLHLSGEYPQFSICRFCQLEFKAEKNKERNMTNVKNHKTHEENKDGYLVFAERFEHMVRCHVRERGRGPECPDWGVIDTALAVGAITAKAYEATEKDQKQVPSHPDIYRSGFKSPTAQLAKERSNQKVHDQSAEDRNIRRQKEGPRPKKTSSSSRRHS